MPVRVYELAKSLGKTNKEVLVALSRLGVEGKTHSSNIEDAVAEKIKAKLAPPPPKPEKPVATAPRPVEAKPDERPPQPQRPRHVAPPGPSAPRPGARLVPTERPKPRPPVATAPKPPVSPPEPEPKTEATPSVVVPETPVKPTVVLEEEVEEKVPDRFRKEFTADKVEKFKAKPSTQRAFQSVRKVEVRKWHDQKGFRRPYPGQKFKEEAKLPLITAPRKKLLKLTEGATVKEFAELIGVKQAEIIKKFMDMGYTPTINQPVDTAAALLVAEAMGVKMEVAAPEEETVAEEAPEDVAKLLPRPPVVTIMGHVDHGKTSLLDVIRETKVTESEVGGITQHIGAYKVSLKGKEIVFLDTPGHEAFTALRARGAKVTDIVVLVVAADDGVMPQTIEAIDHSRAANVPIIVAINKIDKPEANPAKVKNELAELGIIPEEWGGQNIFVEVSAKKRIGIESLLEMIAVQADVMELRANPRKPARGVIIEARLDKGRGPMATVLVQSGALKSGDVFLSGVNAGRVRALVDDTGRRIDIAGPSTPVEVIGFGSVPNAGDPFIVMDDERKARQIALMRQEKQRTTEMAKAHRLTLDELHAKIKEGEIKELNLILKADVQGSIEAVKGALEGIVHPQVKVKVLHASVGGIKESDVMLAAASNAIVIGFTVRPESKAYQTAEREGVDMRLYNIIYEAVDDVKKALEGLLEPTLKEKISGRAEVRQTFPVSRLGTIAGCYVLEGTISRASDGIRLIRDSIVVYEGKIASLKRFKEDVRDVQAGYECGILIENFNDIKAGDIIEAFVFEKIAVKI